MAENCEAFPQEKAPDKASGAAFFAAQTYTVAAEEAATGRVPGYYTFFTKQHPPLRLHRQRELRCGRFLPWTAHRYR